LSFYKTYEEPENTKKESLLDKIFHHQSAVESDNILDQWLIAKLNILIDEVTKQMEIYDLPRSVRPIQEFIDEFSTWWLRRSRDRFKGNDQADKQKALMTFKYVLLELSKVMAPFLPFISENVYQEVGGHLESVHLEKWPEGQKADESLIVQMLEIRKIIELGLAKRSEAGIKIRQPLNKISAFGLNKNVVQEFEKNNQWLEIIKDELNVKQVDYAIEGEFVVKLDTEITEELKIEGVLRELVRTINGMRKDSGLTIKDQIKILWQSEAEIIKTVFNQDNLSNELKKLVLAQSLSVAELEEKAININGESVRLKIEKLQL